MKETSLVTRRVILTVVAVAGEGQEAGRAGLGGIVVDGE